MTARTALTRGAAIVAALVAVWGLWQVWSGVREAGGPPSLPAAGGIGQRDLPQAAGIRGLDRAEPRKILISSINLRAAIDTVGLERDGTLETQQYTRAHRAAWYRLGPAPGEAGPAVITGHVDSTKSGAVFFYLAKVRPGDEVAIVRADRRIAVFTVDSVERFNKSAFPTERVYGPTAEPELRLVTCGGRYDPKRKSYEDNVVVFARLTAVRTET